jgi:nucleoside-diphosphate-sugar epimerase
MKSIAIVGLGWFGLPLAERLKSQGFTIFGSTTNKDKVKELSHFNIKLLNLNSEIIENEYIEFFKDCSICVINIPPSKCLFNSYQNQILSLIRLFNDSCKFIFVSSTSVYSDKIEVAQEDSKILSDFNFTSQLFLTEKSLRNKLKDKLTILRFAGLYGSGRNPAIHLAGKNNLPNGDSPINLVHLEDCISFVEKVIISENWGETFNVCSSLHPTRKQFYTFLCSKNGLMLPSFSLDNNLTVFKSVSNKKGIEKLNFIYKYDSPFDF